MNNNKPTWLENSPWGKRGPRQDRRVVVDGKFVEQTAPIPPTPESEEVNTALEVVHDVSRMEDEGGIAYPQTQEVTHEPSESEKLQADLEPLPVDAVTESLAGAPTAANILSAIDEVSAGESLLDGSVGRTAETETKVESE